MKADWNLHDGWQALQEQVEEGQLFAALTNAAISDVDAVDIAVSVLSDFERLANAAPRGPGAYLDRRFAFIHAPARPGIAAHAR